MRRLLGRPLPKRHAVVIAVMMYTVAMVSAVFVVAGAVDAFLASIFNAPVVAVEKPTAVAGKLVLTQDSWSDMLRDPAYWASRKTAKGNNGPSGGSFWKPPAAAPPIERANLGVFAPPSAKPGRSERDWDGHGDTYRTVCVRLCDGAFFPLSFSTTRGHFDQDAAKCERSCGSASRMFFYKNPGAEPGDMEDQDGRPYKKLATAFLYKTQYVEQCKCKPHPWEEAAVDRHKVFALEVAKAKGSKLADAPLKDLKAKLRQAELEAQAETKRLARAKIDDQKRTVTETKPAKTASSKAASAKTTVSATVASVTSIADIGRSAALPAATKPFVSSKLPSPASAEPVALYQAPKSTVTVRSSVAQTKSVVVPTTQSVRPTADIR